MTAEVIPMRPPRANEDDISALDGMIFDLGCEVKSLNRKATSVSHPVVAEFMKETAAELEGRMKKAKWLRDAMEEKR